MLHIVSHSMSHKIIYKKLYCELIKMEIPNYDVKDDEDNNFTQLYPYMPDRFFRMLICAPAGSGKTNLLLHMIKKTPIIL